MTPSGKGPIIDAHMHLFVGKSERYPRGVHDLYPAERTADVMEYLEYADALGVDFSILVSLDENDEYVRDQVAARPERFGAVAVMDSLAEDPVAEFQRHCDAMPILGYRIWTLGAGENGVPSDGYLDLLAELERREIVAWFYADEVQLNALRNSLHRYPRLNVLLNHLGFCQSGFSCDELGRPRIDVPLPPASLATVVELANFPRVAVMFSGHYAFSNLEYPYPDLVGVSQTLLSAYGVDRLIWASDWPWIKEKPGYAELLNLVRHQLPELTGEEIAAIMGGNAQRIFRIPCEEHQ